MADDIQIQKMDGKSLDVTGVNKEKLKTVFPECFTEGNLDIDKLLSLCGEYIDNDFEKYKFECYRIVGKRSTGTLRPCPEESVDFENTNNLYIEGDNLEVLKLLQTAYYRKVKMIYIDPPYNTGNDFVYEDDFKDPMAKYKEITSQTTKSNPETMGRYHTNWLNMMYPRLRLASNLLRDDGVIFIIIDDNEAVNLLRLCDEVFGEENFVAQMPWRKRTSKSDVPFGVSQDYEWVICYAKSSDLSAGISFERKYYSSPDYPNDRWRLSDLTTQKIESQRPNSAFDLVVPKTGKVYKYNPKRLWGITKDTFQDYYDKGKIVFPDDYKFLNITIPSYRVFESEDKQKALAKYGKEYAMKAMSTVIPSEVGMSEDGNKECAGLLGNNIFSFPKPIALIKYFLNSTTADNDIILDFFSGSATTAHAVMQLNAEDGGKRQFIMVQLPEVTDEKSEAFKAGYKNICEIGKERIRRAGLKYIKDAGVEVRKQETQQALQETGQSETLLNLGMVSSFNTGNGTEATYKNGVVETFSKDGIEQPLTDIGFKVFKLDTSNLVKWDDTPIENTDTSDLFNRMNGMVESIKKDRSELDVVYEVMLKLGIPLTYKVFENEVNGRKVYSIGDDGLILVCLDKSNGGITPEDISAMCDLTPAKIVAAEEAFKDDVALSNAYYISKDKGVEIELL